MASVRGEFLRFAVIALLFFGVVLGIPYLYHLTKAWAAPGIHPQTAITGTWAGVLAPPPLEAKVIARDPYLSEQHYQQSLQEQARQQRDQAMLPRAVYLDMSVSPFSVGNPRLRGVVRMCAYNGAVADFTIDTLAAGEGGGDVMLMTKASDETGNLTFHLAGGQLDTAYDIMGTKLSGKLARGSEQDFQNACRHVKAAAAAVLAER